MPDTVSAPSTFFDKTGRPMPPRLILDGAAKTPAENQWLAAKDAELDNGSVRYHVHSDAQLLWPAAKEGRLCRALQRDRQGTLGASVAVRVDLGYSAIYGTIVKENGHYVAKCRLTITGRSQFE